MDKNIIFQVPGTITGIKSMANNAWRFSVDTQENVSADDLTKMAKLKDKLGWFTLVRKQDDKKIEADELLDLPELVETDVNQKSLSQRLYNVLLVRYTKSGGKKEDFPIWRIRYMERLIQSEKDKIPEE